MVFLPQKRPQLKDFRASHRWENLTHRFFQELEFLDIMDSVENWARKRTISKEKAEQQGCYSKAYIDQSGKLLRLDRVGDEPGEVYIEYQSTLPIIAVEFRTAFYRQGKRIDDEFLQHDWSYKYDKNNRLVELIWHIHPQLEFKYGYCNEQFIFCSYEYDELGLLRKYGRMEGLSVYGEKFSYEKRVTYDREKSQLLAKYTIAKTAWISVAKSRKNTLPFKFGGAPPARTKIPFCRQCGKSLAFICSVKLNTPFKHQSSLPVVPIFYCFDCLEPITTLELRPAIEGQLLRVLDCDTFPEVQLHLGKSLKPEDEAGARVKLGGLPDWIQDENYPTCKKCGGKMMFVSQINSDEGFAGTGQVLMFGDLGRLYTFICCNVVTSVMQCY